MKRQASNLLCAIGLFTLIGCAGTGEVIPIKLHASTPTAGKATTPAKDVRVVVEPFKDARGHKTGLGFRTHLWGGVSYFDLPGNKTGDLIAQALSEFLTARGWHVVKPGGTEQADVTLAGEIQELSVHAKSRFFATELTAKTKLSILAANSADGSRVRMTLNGSGSDDEFWFDNEDMEAVLNEVLTDSFGKLIQDTKIEDNMLRMK